MGYVYFVRVTDVNPIESTRWNRIGYIRPMCLWAYVGRGPYVASHAIRGQVAKGPIRFGPDNSHVEDMRLTEVDNVMESELLARIDIYINE